MGVKDSKFTDSTGEILKRDDWDQDAFVQPSTYFTLTYIEGEGPLAYRKQYLEYRTYPEAMVATIYLLLQGKQVILNCTIESGYSFVIPRDQMPHYLKLYNKHTPGQKYGMHPNYYLLDLNPKTKG